jgi:GntR family transcriptional regulator, carbon starvation induced regulator
VARTATARTRNEQLYLQIRARLLRGEFGPGEPIRTDDLCSRYRVSVSVVREVLTRLAAQGLIRTEANKGFRVPPISSDEIIDLCRARTEIEALTLRLAVEHGDVAWEASVIAAHHELARTPRVSISEDPEANERWSIVHARFHEACAAGCRSRRLCLIRQQLFDEAEVFRQYARLHGAGRNVEAEHAALAEALVARDGARAVRLVREHVEATARANLAALADRATGERPGRVA